MRFDGHGYKGPPMLVLERLIKIYIRRAVKHLRGKREGKKK